MSTYRAAPGASRLDAARGALLVGVAALVLAVLLAPGASAAAVSPQFFGVTYDRAAATAPAPLQTEQFGAMERTGVGAVRTVFSWAHAQPERGGAFDFERTDALVADATAADVELLPIVMYAPAWARKRPGRTASPPKDPRAYARYLAALVDRYGPRGRFWAEHPAAARASAARLADLERAAPALAVGPRARLLAAQLHRAAEAVPCHRRGA